MLALRAFHCGPGEKLVRCTARVTSRLIGNKAYILSPTAEKGPGQPERQSDGRLNATFAVSTLYVVVAAVCFLIPMVSLHAASMIAPAYKSVSVGEQYPH